MAVVWGWVGGCCRVWLGQGALTYISLAGAQLDTERIHLQWKARYDMELSERRLVVAFTFGDRQDADIEKDLERVCPELKSVLKNASKRYVVFNDKDDDEGKRRTVDTLLKMVQKIDTT